MPCGYIIKFGFQPMLAGDNPAVNVTMSQGPALTSIFNVQLTTYIGGSAINPQSIHYYVAIAGGNAFSIKSNSSVGYTIFYSVIGSP